MIDSNALYDAMNEVESSAVEKLVRDYLKQGESAKDILNRGLLPAMSVVGEQFKRDEIFIPEVLLAARNLHKGLDILRPILIEGDTGYAGTFMIGTVKGDIHDVGKNIVAIMMESAGLHVIDLGIDVSTEKFVEAVSEHKPDILGLSALLTTTMVEMRSVIGAIRKTYGPAAPKMMVGGAPVNQTFADSIGADGYAPEAPSAVEVALKLLHR
jgi:5-methyltetrahydrofolate--homocysteine methyltransferase